MLRSNWYLSYLSSYTENQMLFKTKNCSHRKTPNRYTNSSCKTLGVWYWRQIGIYFCTPKGWFELKFKYNLMIVGFVANGILSCSRTLFGKSIVFLPYSDLCWWVKEVHCRNSDFKFTKWSQSMKVSFIYLNLALGFIS